MSEAYSVKMRASSGGNHVSGAEKIVSASSVSKVASRLVERALSHERGTPDFINVKVEALPEGILRLKALPVKTHVVATPAEGRALAARLLADAGISRIDEIMARFSETHSLRGAMLLDADTLERLEPDKSRGVRATYMDDAASIARGTAGVKNHYAEAIVLATKVQNAPGIVAEICVSDDPDYVTGYVATRELGYRRITVLKEKGDPNGGRIFLYRGPRDGVAKTIEFESRRAAGLWRECRTLEGPTGPTAIVGGRELVVFASNDYLDLARDPRVVKAAADAANEFGAGSGGSRLTTGTQPVHLRLEDALAKFKGSESALLYGTGYMANVGAISSLVGKGDAVLSDELNHASIIDGCRLSGADVLVYRHGDMEDLDRKLGACREHRRRLAVSDGVFSMDGDILDLPRFLEVTRRHDALSMVDEAHATGVVGCTGRGLSEHFGCDLPDILRLAASRGISAKHFAAIYLLDCAWSARNGGGARRARGSCCRAGARCKVAGECRSLCR